MIIGGRFRAVVVYLWALRAVSYGAFSNDATGMPIAMKPHCECAFLMAVTEQEGLGHPSEEYQGQSQEPEDELMLTKRTRQLGLPLVDSARRVLRKEHLRHENMKWKVRPQSQESLNSMPWSEWTFLTSGHIRYGPPLS